MEESQNIEFKESWHDEYLRQICGLANTHGGIMYIGVNDKGEVVGVKNAKKLQEDISNKVRDTLGILPEVGCNHEDDKDVVVLTIQENLNITCMGERHKVEGTPCQDYSLSMNTDRLTLAVVCNGHGAPQYFRSEIGARYAAEAVKKCVFDIA